jgi:hypothetical protein
MTNEQMIMSPLQWPRWPLLPMQHRTRKHDDSRLGFVVASEEFVTACREGGKLTVYVGKPYIFDVGLYKSLRDFIDAHKTTEQFDSVAAILKEWRID